MVEQEQPLQIVARELGMVPGDGGPAAARQALVSHINSLIQNDFQQLISVLYRMDVSENKLKLLLKEQPGMDAGEIIADLMIERQVQKIKSRQQFGQRDKNIDEEEKW